MEHSYWETDSEIYTVLEIKLWLMLVKKTPKQTTYINAPKVLAVSFFFFLSLVLLFVRSGQTKHWYEVW